jgi:hypothetical protein
MADRWAPIIKAVRAAHRETIERWDEPCPDCGLCILIGRMTAPRRGASGRSGKRRKAVTFDARNVLAFVFAKIGQHPEDELMVKAADACFGAAIALLPAIDDNDIRERAITERDAKTIDLIRNMAAMLDAVHHGELQVERKN